MLQYLHPILTFIVLDFVMYTNCCKNPSFIISAIEGTSWAKFRLLRMIPPEDYVRDSTVSELRFTQKLNHFDKQDSRTWEQLYFVTDRHWGGSNSPVFLLLGGEGPANMGWMYGGQWEKNAAKYKALMFHLEHRFYGKSRATPDLSTDNLQYLSSQLALEDAAEFVRAQIKKYKLNPENKWIVFGGSYPGNLAAWMRLKYPDLIHGAVASSAPLKAKVNFKEFMGVVRDSLDFITPGCGNVISQASKELDKLLKTRYGARQISKKFKLCCPLDRTNAEDVATFYLNLAGLFSNSVQYHGQTSNVSTLCDIMMKESIGSPIDRYATVCRMHLQNSCLNVQYSEYVKHLSKPQYEVEPIFRSWMYQSCHQFGYFQTSDSKPSPVFGDKFGIRYFHRQCVDYYSFTDEGRTHRGVCRTNGDYSGIEIPKKISNIVYVYGSLDPWKALGIPKEDPDAIYITGTSHCHDMVPDTDKDSEELKQARERISQLIGQWLNQ